MTQYPEHEKLEKVSAQSQSAGEFLEWLVGKFVFCKYNHPEYGDWPVPQHFNHQELLAEYFGIDLKKIDAEKAAMLEVLRKIREEPKDWYFTFGCGQQYAGHYHVIHGTYESALQEMHSRFGEKWSMQYASREEAGVDEWNLKELK